MKLIRLDKNNQVNGAGLRCVVWVSGRENSGGSERRQSRRNQKIVGTRRHTFRKNQTRAARIMAKNLAFFTRV